MSSDLADQVYQQFISVNGQHPMAPQDDSYVNDNYVDLRRACSGRLQTPDEIRHDMLGERLPLPSYLRSDRVEMVPADYFQLADQAGGVERLPEWFRAHWDDPKLAAEEWDSYLSGQYVCLRQITPATIQQKTAVSDGIKRELEDPRPESGAWLDRLHALIDELDSITAPFTDYDRHRFGGPVSRDVLINEIRAKYPRPRG